MGYTRFVIFLIYLSYIKYFIFYRTKQQCKINLFYLKLQNKTNERSMTFKSCFFSLSADINVVNIGWLFLIWSYRNWWGDGRFGNLLNLHCPFVFWLLQITQSVFWLSIWYTNEYSCLCQNSIHLWNHFASVGCWVFTALKLSHKLPRQNQE